MDSVVSTSSLGGSMDVPQAPAHAIHRRMIPPPPVPKGAGSAPTPPAPAPTKRNPSTTSTAMVATAPRRAAATASFPLAARVLPRRILTTFLRQRGVAHCAASTGADAVAQYAAWALPLVLMDFQLAVGMDGLEATRQTRAVESAGGATRSPRAVIVALSAGAAEANRRAALATGIVEWACMQAIIGHGAAGGRAGAAEQGEEQPGRIDA
ncbi:hypothetical protein AMAG_18439 [Allomyces macrogynus ATCC 38327]|uniref:Response regulatory domain-containing protein n=1 Tax=Allomyces macrogynus (strain ATCC 38327) TaxID=578462 RepID=A0A0L0SBF6_ALLM3|nr:hypothetical protein AMAG_18439 [Allomyces macrogynus ATCC 38327]|eukprot:KNE59893.1 hypothetical protein AMAG_18439 [Allomyces macrogynus ATCC 38327]